MGKISRILPAIHSPAQKRAAAYARVSVESEDARNSLAAQVSYYSSFIRQNGWEFAGIYADEGVSGTEISKRTEFLRLLKDCEEGKIDIILTKSVSRFARNTVNLLKTVRHLRELGVGVVFEKENINSLSAEGELLLTVLSSFAQEESRSISENVKWAIRRGFERGKTNTPRLFGYRSVGGELVVEPREAEIVKLIYDNYLSGHTAKQTVEQLRKMGARTLKGNYFSRFAVYDILRQEKYTGDALLQKYFIEDHITHKKRKNRGETAMYFVENSHGAIIDRETFRRVREEMDRRREGGIFASGAVETSCFTSRIKCGRCMKNYRRYGRYNKKNERKYSYWGCSSRKKNAKLCCGENIPEERLREVCAAAMGDAEFVEERFSAQVKNIIMREDGRAEFVFYNREERKIFDWGNF